MSMLMPQSGKPAKIHYMANDFRLLSHGDHVLCAVSGEKIPLEQLRYWSVARQEAYAGAALATEAELRA